MQTIGFIGAGRIARIMLEGWKRSGFLPPTVVVYDLDGAAADKLAAAYKPVSVGDLDEVAAADLVVVGLHPPVLANVLPQIAPRLRPDAIVLSLAPKLKFAALSSLLGGFGRLARQNPNAASIIDCGFNPIAFADALTAEDRDMLLALMRPLGDCPVVDEATIEAYVLISAMGPAYLWFQLNDLEHLAEEFGLSEAAARQAVAAMAHGAAATLLESDLAADDVMNLVPVKPLGADEQTFIAAYRDRLRPLYAKLTA
ncbi:MAG: NAD(P)-binding domain-containing protein [Xanthobacteraceae bacterium]|nr:NAD(P)-binding domain-containing protein [Xanthobacteraceae bacterium]